MAVDPPPLIARYEVAVSGKLGPALSAWFGDFGLSQKPAATVFRLELAPDQGADDISAMLRANGLVLLSARKLPSRDDPIRTDRAKTHDQENS
jgi:hypothetical protein